MPVADTPISSGPDKPTLEDGQASQRPVLEDGRESWCQPKGDKQDSNGQTSNPRILQRLRLAVRGAVQGVGFRPFVHRLAHELGLGGFVLNDPSGVKVEVEGGTRALDEFCSRLLSDCPRLAAPDIVERVWLKPRGQTAFAIHPSEPGGDRTAVILPDASICPDCRRELWDPSDRRCRYPFINCTNCGPRFSILEALPYDRPNTSMRDFAMCPDCTAEYRDPLDRRFHAQPNACFCCGPRITLEDGFGQTLATGDAALRQAAEAVRSGRILALKGLGGFQLVVDGLDEAAVTRLRHRKARWEKPFAIMVPSLETAREVGELPPAAEELLVAPEAPIVLIRRRPEARVAEAVAPQNPWLGVMLPYTPLHELLLNELGQPVVATSGNRSDEPICIGNSEALQRLCDIADLWLMHDRPIVRQVDDSVVAVMDGGSVFLRRSRGYAPRPLPASGRLPTVLSLGAQLKCTIALGLGREVLVSQHIGDLSNPEAVAAHERVVRDFLSMFDAWPVALVHDLHPDYHSTLWAAQLLADSDRASCSDEIVRRLHGASLLGVQHHHAHFAACLADNRTDGPALGVAWDGTGYGPDGTVWGGEFLAGDIREVRRTAHLRPFRLPGSEAAIREPRRALLGLLWELDPVQARIVAAPHFSDQELDVLSVLLERRTQSPVTTSAGRLFDAVAVLLGGRVRVGYEGQAAIELEFLADPSVVEAYPLPLIPGESEGQPGQLDWGPLVWALLSDRKGGVRPSVMAARFHHALAAGMLAVAEATALPRVALTGGCFQNQLLTRLARQRLERAGFSVLVHHQVPANDGGISFGQVLVAARHLTCAKGESSCV
ncbi:carbamoyltransferase HypF [Myxococcota bacterium]